MNKIVKLTVVLFLVCAIVAGVLGGVNLITKDKIAEQDRIKTEKAYAAVLASDNGYTEVSFDKTAFPTVDSINECNNGAGWVVTTTFSGAQGSITMAVGVDTDMKCTGISIISHAETSGLGAKAARRDPRPGEPQRRRERRHRQHELHAAQALRADPSGQIRLEQHRKQPQQQRRSGQQ